MTDSTILVTGATGKTGRRVAEILRHRGHDVRAVSRSTRIPFDWDDEGTWPAALEGVGAIYVVTTALYDPETPARFASFARLAREHGAKHVVMVSVPSEGADGFSVVQDTERQFVEAGLGLTVLRLRWFNQNFTEDFLRPAVVSGDLRLPAGDGAEAFVDADDIAEVAAVTLSDPGYAGRSLELTGPRTLTFTDIAREISEATGRPVTYTALSAEEYVSEQIAQGVPEDWAHISAALYTSIASGALQSTSSDIAELLGRPARDFRQFAQNAAAEGSWGER